MNMKMKTVKVPGAAAQHQDSTALAQVEAALAVLTECTGNPKLHIQQARLFLHVAAHREVLQTGLAEAVGITQSSVSRNVALLGKGVRLGEAGYGLLESGEVPNYRRCKVVWLTEKGNALAWEMQRAVNKSRLNEPQQL